MKQTTKLKLFFGMTISLLWQSAFAHDPNFGIGPHVLFKSGIETALETHYKKSGEQKAAEAGLQMTYGITGDWAAGIELPYAYKEQANTSASGVADFKLFTKYRFWRKDSLGLQESAAIMVAANLNNGDETTSPKLGNGASDLIGGLTYGYESLKWYRWASVRYRYNGKNNSELHVGNKTLVDFVVGWRPDFPIYKKPDTVWLLELNTEIGQKNELKGVKNANSGGVESFISPGIFWTYRNFAIKSGIQIAIFSDLNGVQEKSNFRVRTSFEWHL